MTPHEQAAAAFKTAPGLTLTAMSFGGYSINEWLALLTLFYTAIQMGVFLRRLLLARRVRDGDPLCAATCEHIKRAREEP